MNLTEFQGSQLARALADTIAGGPLLGLLVDLYQTPIAITPLTPLATFLAAIATFVGYAQGTVTWALPSVADSGEVEVVGSLATWRPTNSVTPNQIYGAYASLAAGPTLALAGQFDTAPLPMVSNLDLIIATVRYRPSGTSMINYVS